MFISNPIGLRRIKFLKRLQSAYIIMNAMGIYACLFKLPLGPLHSTMTYIATAMVTAANGGIFYYSRRNCRETVLSIEWDIFTEEFVVKKADPWMGLHETRIALKDFRQVKGDDSSLYMNAASGESFKTINRGTWFNNGLLYHLFE